jgi:RNA polymerase sigma-70 factor (ECF subfamily)
MSPPLSRPSLDHATLVAAITPGTSPSSERARRDACKLIAAQVYRVVAAVLGRASPDVGDAAQEAFIRLYDAIPSFEPDPSRPHGAAAWVNKIALRTTLDRLRHQRRIPERADDHDCEGAAADFDVEDRLDDKELVAALFQRLDAKERAVLVLRYWSEETDEEIAETLGIPLGTVKTRLRAASAKLRSATPRIEVTAAPLASAGAERAKA